MFFFCGCAANMFVHVWYIWYSRAVSSDAQVHRCHERGLRLFHADRSPTDTERGKFLALGQNEQHVEFREGCKVCLECFRQPRSVNPENIHLRGATCLVFESCSS